MGFLSTFLYSQLFVTPPYPVKSFAGQTVIVTGSNTGLGLEAARHFVRLDAEKVIIAVRNVSAGQRAKQSIEESTGRENVCEVWELDLASYASVQAFAKRASTELSRIDVLLENAGLATEQFKFAENQERTITVNVISTFLLGLLLLPKMEETADKDKNPTKKPRWTIVCSGAHALTNFPEYKEGNTFANLSNKEKSDMTVRYPTSKLLEVLIVRELAPKITNSKIILNMTDPGLCHSELAREAGFSLWLMKLLLGRKTEVGSRCLVASAVVGDESHGAYISNGEVSNQHLSAFVISDGGRKAQENVWSELKEVLENIVPGVTAWT
ncbi:hypothetical protein UA08_06419 [Talaromyces atroroseus]|uniref:Uncharacterized protein n=1 Tax=Talaromyces atroroseus TaxID=1441469 RepID=A0A225AU17_TALAT|nr:hypothetical protein UA08_06419 [Talaromyces atroroseus]OKL57905.1 hypothetical protein UA08_06419 [Talaromyces atroroseus]